MTETGPENFPLRDREVIWHPFSQHELFPTTLPVASAEGAYINLADGRKVLDGISSWYVNIHGHCHPEIVKAISRQASKLDHVIFAGFTHQPAVELADVILSYPAIKNAGLARAFYSDNGSTAVEVALKMAYQFYVNRGEKKRDRFLALNDSYHGDTLGAMAVSDPNGFNEPFRKLLPKVDFVQPGDIERFESLVRENSQSYAAFIFEPILQGVSGMKLHSAEFISRAVEICKEEGILTIADEIFTGFFRTGKCFAIEHTKVKPDLLCIAKGITGGVLPLAVTLTTEQIFEGFLSKEIRTAFLHGHSYTANPIACAAALASWKLLHSEECQKQIAMISSVTCDAIKKLESHPNVAAARSIGVIGAVDLKSVGNYFSGNSKRVMDLALDRGVLLRPLGSTLYSLPPYCVSKKELETIFGVMAEIAEILS